MNSHRLKGGEMYKNIKGFKTFMGSTEGLREYNRHREEEKRGDKGDEMNIAWDVYLKGKLVTTVFFDNDMRGDEVKQSLINHDGYSPEIILRPNLSLTSTKNWKIRKNT